MYNNIQLWYSCNQVNKLIKILFSFEDISQIYNITTVYIIILFEMVVWMKTGEKVGARVNFILLNLTYFYCINKYKWIGYKFMITF